MGPPVDDAAFGSPKDLFELPVGPVVENVIASIAIEDEELAVGQVQGPGRTVFVGLGILAGILRQRPFLKDLAVWSGLDDLMPLEVGQVEHLPSGLGHQREAVGSGKLRAPFVDQPPFSVVHDDVVLRLIGEEEDVPLTVDDESMAVIDRRLRTQIPPSGNHPVAETPVPENGGLSSQNVWKPEGCDRGERSAGGCAQSGPEKGTSGVSDHGWGAEWNGGLRSVAELVGWNVF